MPKPMHQRRTLAVRTNTDGAATFIAHFWRDDHLDLPPGLALHMRLGERPINWDIHVRPEYIHYDALIEHLELTTDPAKRRYID